MWLFFGSGFCNKCNLLDTLPIRVHWQRSWLGYTSGKLREFINPLPSVMSILNFSFCTVCFQMLVTFLRWFLMFGRKYKSKNGGTTFFYLTILKHFFQNCSKKLFFSKFSSKKMWFFKNSALFKKITKNFDKFITFSNIFLVLEKMFSKFSKKKSNFSRKCGFHQKFTSSKNFQKIFKNLLLFQIFFWPWKKFFQNFQKQNFSKKNF